MRKFFAALLCALIPLSAAWAKDVTVKSFSPQGEVSSARPQISVVFSGSVADKSQIGTVLKGSAVPIKFRPALLGSAKWTASDRLVFTPNADLLPATRYDADFGPGGLRTANGQLVAGAQSFSFHRPPLSFDRLTVLNTSPSRVVTLRLTFSTEVAPQRLRGFLSVYNDLGRSVNYSVRGDAPSREVIIETEPIYGKSLRAVVAGGLLPEKGDLPQKSELEATVSLSTATTVTDSEAYTLESGRGVIRVELNSRVDIAKAKGFIELSPSVPFTLNGNYDGFSITGDFAPRSRVSLTIRKGLTGVDSQPMAEDFTKSFIFPDVPSFVRFPAAGTFLTTAEAPRVAVETSNIETLQLSTWKLYGNNVGVAALDLDGWRDDFKRWAKPLGTKKFSVGGMANEITRRAANLSALGCDGEGIYLIEASNADPDTWDRATTLLCVTDTALSARLYKRGIQVWAASISGAKPLAGADVKVYSANNQLLLSGMTDADGTASFGVPDGWDANLQPSLVTAEKDGALTFVKLGTNQLSGRDVDVSGAPWKDAYEGLWILPRGLWQPGETLQAQAIVRAVALDLPGEFPLKWTFSGRGIELASGTLTLDANGAGTISVPIPDTAESGSYSLKLLVPGAQETVAERTVSVEEFRPPQIETELKAPEVLFPGTEAALSFGARYLFGAGGAGLKWSLSYTTVPETYVSKNNPGFVFGSEAAKDAGHSSGTIASGVFGEDSTASAVWTPEADLKAASIIRAHLRLNVMEANGRWTGSTVSVPLFPSRALIGVLKPGAALRPNSPAEIALAAVDTSDNPIDLGTVNVEISKVTNRYVLMNDGSGSRMTWQEELSEPERDTVTLNGRGKYVFTPKDEGQYLIAFSGADGRASVRLSVWENWHGSAPAGASMPDRVEMKADSEAYAAGSTARIALKSPFPGRAVLTVGSDRPIAVRSFDMTGAEMVVEIPVTDAMLPNGWAAIQVVRPEGAGTKPPYRALGALPIRLDLSGRKLGVKVEAPEKSEPGTLNAKVFVTDADGKAVDGTVSIAFVDRGILLLSGEDNENPFDYFTRRRAMDGKLCDVYDSLLPIEARGTALLHPAGGSEAAMSRMKLMANGDMMSPVRAEDYKPLSVWLANVPVKNGVAEVSADIPEFAGALRVEAVALSGVSSGRGETETKISRPVVIDLTLPRFASPGDMIQPALNITAESDGQAEVTVTPSESLDLNANGAAEWKTSATLMAGKRLSLSDLIPPLTADENGAHGSLKAEVRMNGRVFSAETGLAIRPAWPLVSLTGGGQAEGTIEFDLPDSWYPGTGEVSLALAGAPVADALSLLATLDSWGCSLDRLISRGWITLYLPELFAEGDKDLSNANENRIAMNTILAGLSGHQLYDGSWSAWRNGGCDAWGSVAALHLLTAVDAAGVIHPSGVGVGTQWLRRYMAESIPEEEAAAALNARAYGCYVLALAGEAPLGWMNWLEERAGSLSGSGRALLAGSFALAGEREKARTMLGAESGGAATVSLPEAGFRLLALDALEPGGSDARTLAADIASALSRDGGRMSAREAGSVLMALGVFNSHVAAGPAQAKIFDAEGREVLSYDGTPSIWKGKRGGRMTLTASGPGSLWYSWTATGVPASEPENYARGVTVERTFIDPKTKAPVDMDAVDFGREVIMKIKVTKTAQADELRLCAMLPAGFEAADAGKKVAGKNVEIRSDLRFDRLLLNIGGRGTECEWQISCRAACRGNFTVPPVSVEALGNKGVGFLGRAEFLTVQGN